jgi:hypothetical protein
VRLERSTCAKLAWFGYQAATLRAGGSAVRDLGLADKGRAQSCGRALSFAALLWILILLAMLSLHARAGRIFSGHSGGCGRKWYMVLVGALGRGQVLERRWETKPRACPLDSEAEYARNRLGQGL